MRNLRITSPEQVRDPALRTLLEAATVTGVPPIRERWPRDPLKPTPVKLTWHLHGVSRERSY
jgi:hypothetical protein